MKKYILFITWTSLVIMMNIWTINLFGKITNSAFLALIVIVFTIGLYSYIYSYGVINYIDRNLKTYIAFLIYIVFFVIIYAIILSHLFSGAM